MTPRNARIASVAIVSVAAALGVRPLVATSQENGPGDDAGSLATDASRRAADRALRWLVDHQEDDGSWRCNVGFKLNNEYRVEHENLKHVGITALAGTAFLASGSVPGRGPYAENVEKA